MTRHEWFVVAVLASIILATGYIVAWGQASGWTAHIRRVANA